MRSGFDVAAGHQATTRLLSAVQRPTAIFAVNDFAAIDGLLHTRLGGADVESRRLAPTLVVRESSGPPLS